MLFISYPFNVCLDALHPFLVSFVFWLRSFWGLSSRNRHVNSRTKRSVPLPFPDLSPFFTNASQDVRKRHQKGSQQETTSQILISIQLKQFAQVGLGKNWMYLTQMLSEIMVSGWGPLKTWFCHRKWQWTTGSTLCAEDWSLGRKINRDLPVWHWNSLTNFVHIAMGRNTVFRPWPTWNYYVARIALLVPN